jgi:hypothetical protein
VKRSLSILLAWWLAGCGTNKPEIPPELLENPGTGNDCSTTDYPRGPYGKIAGSVARDVCFEGWRNPAAAPHAESSLEPLSLGAFYDPTGENHEIILLNTAAVWCAVCKNEHRSLDERHAALAPRGLVILSALFQNNAGDPAVFADLKLWVETFKVEFPMVLDPEYQLGDYATAETAPLNLVIDARTMQIIEKFVGDQGSVIWPLIEDELARREASE